MFQICQKMRLRRARKPRCSDFPALRSIPVQITVSPSTLAAVDVLNRATVGTITHGPAFRRGSGASSSTPSTCGNRRAAGTISAHGIDVAQGHLFNQVLNLLEDPGAIEEIQRFARHLTVELPALFSFLVDPRIDATNWRAEQALPCGRHHPQNVWRRQSVAPRRRHETSAGSASLNIAFTRGQWLSPPIVAGALCLLS